MHAFLKPARLFGGLTLLALCGCHTYSPYGPYGSGYGYPPPGTYAVPRSQYVPGGTVVPGTVVPNGGGGTITPGRTNSGSAVSPQSNSGGSAFSGQSPTIEANRGTGGLLPNEKPVPDPKGTDAGFPSDPAGPVKSGTTGGAAKPTSGTFSPAPTSGGAKGTTDGFPAGRSPFDSGAAASTGAAKINLTGSDKDDNLQEPGRFQQPKAAAPIAPAGTPAQGGSSTTIDPASPAAPAGGTPMSSTTGTPSPYDYDRQHYTWLRGKVDYEEGTKTWQIIYNLDGKDKYGGSLTLSDSPLLKKLRNDDVALVEGRIDPARKTGRGKPLFVVETLFGPLIPKTKVGSFSPAVANPARGTVATNAR